MLLRYYRRTPDYTKELSSAVVSLLPLAVIIHFLFGILVYSYPRLFKSSTEGDKTWFGIQEVKYFTADRIGQTHVVGLIFVMCFHVILFGFESSFVSIWRWLYKVSESKMALLFRRPAEEQSEAAGEKEKSKENENASLDASETMKIEDSVSNTEGAENNNNDNKYELPPDTPEKKEEADNKAKEDITKAKGEITVSDDILKELSYG